MFERFTERAARVVLSAQDEARALRHNYIGTEHLLLALLRDEDGLAGRVFETFDLDVEDVRANVTRIVGLGDDPGYARIPFTRRAKHAIEAALREASALGHDYGATEHVLLGVLRVRDGVAVRILLDFDVEPQGIQNEVVRMLSGRPGPVRHVATDEPPPYEPSVPPVPRKLVDELRATREAKKRLIGEGRLDEAAAAREHERELVRRARRIELGEARPRELDE